MARKHLKLLIEVGLFSLTIALVAALVTGAGWGLWIIFIGWILNGDADRIMIIGTSVFWLSVGVLSWLIRSNRKR